MMLHRTKIRELSPHFKYPIVKNMRCNMAAKEINQCYTDMERSSARLVDIGVWQSHGH